MFSIKITRRQFLKWISASAAVLGLSQTDLLKVEKALAAGPTPDPTMPLSVVIPGHPGTLGRVVWITGQDCGGCATTLLNFLADPGDLEPTLALTATNSIPTYATVDAEVLYTNLNPVINPDFPDGDVDIAEVVLEIVSIEWGYIVMAGSGDVANDYLLNTVIPGGGYVLMMDGAIPTNASGKYCQIMDVKGDVTTRLDWAAEATPYVNVYTTTEETNNVPSGQKRTEVTMAAASLWLAKNAAAVVCLGTCNSWGGIPAAKGAVTGAKSGWEWINGGPAYGGNSLGKLLCNIPGCAPNSDWFVATVAAALLELNGVIPGCLTTNIDTSPDQKGRPKLTYTGLNSAAPIYHADSNYAFCEECPRRGKGDATSLEDGRRKSGQEDGKCLNNVGCNGWMVDDAHVFPDCPTRMWNKFEDMSKNNWCVRNNMPCQGCASPGFPDWCSPFYAKTKGSWRGYNYTS